jgi:mannosidase alpha-like ER degradation enhancer 2
MRSSAKWLFIAALWLRGKSISSVESRAVPEEMPTKSENIFQSLWETFKQNLETSAGALSSKPSSVAAQMDKTTQYTQHGHRESTSRRFLLMKKTIQEHYLKNEQVGNSFDENYLGSVRWSREVAGTECMFFSEFPGAFWSFQWCPQSAIYQGRRNEDMALDAQLSLGIYIDLESEAMTEVASSFHSQLSSLFPGSHIELYHEGEFCEDLGDKRVSAVVIHDDSSLFCPSAQLTHANAYAISRVDEPQTCAYVLHVCKPSPEARHSVPTSEHMGPTSSPGELNQTMKNTHRLVAAYLRQTNSQILTTSNPDQTSSLHEGLPPLPPSRIQSNLNLVKDMFMHAYDSYMYNAYPASEVKPLTCKPAVFDLVRIPALTLIDSLDTLIILGNYTEFARSVERLRGLDNQMAEEYTSRFLGRGGLFRLNQNVSVFETNIRVLGGLLSAHQLAEATMSVAVLESEVWDANGAVLIGDTSKLICGRDENAKVSKDVEDFSSSLLRCKTVQSEDTTCQNRTSKHWKYDGFLLELAQDIGDRLLPAFSTRTGIPYGTVNLMSGIPKDETTIASLAGGGTLSLEMELLSRLTGNEEYGRAAKLAARALWMRRSRFNTYGKHICTQRGDWTESLSGIGSNSDSFFEYLIKHYILFPEDHDFWYSMVSAYGGVHNESRLGDWYADVDLNRGLSTNGSARQVFEALMAFYPGMQILLGELIPAAHSLNSFFLVREFLGFLPERFDYGSWKVDGGGGAHFLRPELLESAYFLHRATRGFQQQRTLYANNTGGFTGWQWAADYALHTLDSLTRCDCGFASVKHLSPSVTGAAGLGVSKKPKLLDEMPSFFLSETLKYLYLTFDDGNILHVDEDREWVFTTEAHPMHHSDLATKRDRESRLEDQKNELIKRLQSRLQGKERVAPSAWRILDNEKWTDGSPLEMFLEQMEPIVSQSNQASPVRSDTLKSTITEPILLTEHVYSDLDIFDETQNGLNDAHLALRRTGNGVSLTKSCPNFYSPELLYVRALNGGATDYSNAYASSMKDAIGLEESRFLMLGSVDALAWHGSGVHITQAYDTSTLCPLADKQKEKVKSKNESKPKPQEKEQAVSNRFDGGELGNFEILPFSGGVGFSIRRVECGESFATTLLQDETSDSMETYLMVVSTSPVSDRKDGDEPESEPNGDSETKSTVIMADLAGNSHTCQIEIVRNRDYSNSRDSDEKARISGNAAMETVLARYPCAPGMFGPTHIRELAKVDEIIVQAPLLPPARGDENGCISNTGPLSDAFLDRGKCETTWSEEGCQSKVVQLVQRGVCAFQEKSLNQVNAEAVIVINSGEGELFVMSGNADEQAEDLDGQTYPVTVLVTGSDGEDILNLIEASHDQLLSRVSLFREKPRIKENGSIFSVTQNRFWPVVSASPDAIRIFAEGGWGVQAAQKNNIGAGKDVEWQLYLMKHSAEEISETSGTMGIA